MQVNPSHPGAHPRLCVCLISVQVIVSTLNDSLDIQSHPHIPTSPLHSMFGVYSIIYWSLDNVLVFSILICVCVGGGITVGELEFKYFLELKGSCRAFVTCSVIL